MSTSNGSESDSNALFSRGLDLYRTEEWRAAVKVFEEVAELEPKSSATQFMIGNTCIEVMSGYGDDQESAMPWARKVVAAFGRAVRLDDEIGGLTASQREKAFHAGESLKQLIERLES